MLHSPQHVRCTGMHCWLLLSACFMLTAPLPMRMRRSCRPLSRACCLGLHLLLCLAARSGLCLALYLAACQGPRLARRRGPRLAVRLALHLAPRLAAHLAPRLVHRMALPPALPGPVMGLGRERLGGAAANDALHAAQPQHFVLEC